MQKSFILALLITLLATAALASFKYEIVNQKETLEFGTHGRVLLNKEFTFKVLPESTDKGTEIWVGLPTANTKVNSVNYYQADRLHTVDFKIRKSDNSQNVIFTDFPAIIPGESLTFQFYAEIPDLIYWLNKEQPNLPLAEQKVAVSYIPAWWDKAETKDLTLELRFAPKLDLNGLNYLKGTPATKEQLINMAVVTYHYQNVKPDTKFEHAIVLPKSYFNSDFVPKGDWLSTGQIALIVSIVGFGILFLVIIIAAIASQARYQTPAAYITGKEACTTFDPVEAALFFNVPGDLLIKLIVMGLMEKNIVKMEQNGNLRKEPTLERLTWYEELFLDTIDENVQVKKEKWPEFSKKTVTELKELLGGYCGAQTSVYYKKLLKEMEITEATDPRWLALKDYLDKKMPERVNQGGNYEPAYLNTYLPLFYLNFISKDQEKERQAAFNGTFVSTTAGKGGTGGGSCACACACACASSGGCT